MLLLLTVLPAWAAPTESVATISGGVAGVSGVSPSSFGVLGAGRLRLNFGRSSLELAGKEGYLTSDERTVGNVAAFWRYLATDNVFIRLGLTHVHETPMAVMRREPIAAFAGTAKGIRHRSGFEGGVGYEFLAPIALGSNTERYKMSVDLSTAWLPDDLGPSAYFMVETAYSIDLGK